MKIPQAPDSKNAPAEPSEAGSVQRTGSPAEAALEAALADAERDLLDACLKGNATKAEEARNGKLRMESALRAHRKEPPPQGNWGDQR